VRADKLGFGLADVTPGPGTPLELAARAGAGWLLGWVSWEQVEPRRGVFAWQSGGANDLDNVAAAGRAAGLRVLVRLHSPPAWATADGSGRLARVDPDALRLSLEALARRGAGRVTAYQVFNEPNLAYEWGEDVDEASAAAYARLLRAAYGGLKAGDPRALVVSAGLANGATAPSLNDLDYLRALYAAGARGTFDALATHPYGGNTPPESTACGGTCFRRAEVQRQLMDLPTGETAAAAWRNHGTIHVVETRDEAAALADEHAFEHVEVLTEEPRWYLQRLRNYGALFLGEGTTVAYGDKTIGTNHILPTAGAARYSGGLWVGKFLKTITHQEVRSPESALLIGETCARQCRVEGFEGHARTCDVRVRKLAS
jgi:hypothetical protein